MSQICLWSLSGGHTNLLHYSNFCVCAVEVSPNFPNCKSPTSEQIPLPGDDAPLTSQREQKPKEGNPLNFPHHPTNFPTSTSHLSFPPFGESSSYLKMPMSSPPQGCKSTLCPLLWDMHVTTDPLSLHPLPPCKAIPIRLY